jgi:hypothetical protein
MAQIPFVRRLRWLQGIAVVLALCAPAAADTTPPQLVGFSISPLLADISSGPAALTVTIAARNESNGFDSGVANSGSIVLTHESGTSVFGRQNLPMTGGTTTNPVFQFTLNVPKENLPGVYHISILLVDNAFNSATFSATDLQARGFPSTITVTQGGFGGVTLIPPSTNVPEGGGSGSLLVTARSAGFSWSAVSNASWLTIISGASGTGNGIITYTTVANSSPAPRSGIITVSGQTFIVVQAAASSFLSLAPSALSFAYQVGGVLPASQTLTAYSSGAQLNFTATASSVGNWLFVSPTNGATSTTLNVFVNPVGLAPGTYVGTVTVAAAGSSNRSQIETVTLNVSATPPIAITPSSLSFSYQQGSPSPPPQVLSVTAVSATNFFVSTSASWLIVSPISMTGLPVQPPGTTSAIVVSVSPSGLTPGSYTGSVSISASTGTQTVPVTLIVTATQAITVNPSSFTFTYVIGGDLPTDQQLFVSGVSGLSFTATASSATNWLRLGVPTVTAPGGLSIAVNPSALQAGVYWGTITLTADSTALQIVPVTLIVTASRAISVSPNSLTFNARPGAFQSKILFINTTTPGAAISAVASSSGNWLVVFLLSTVTPGTLTVSADSSRLGPGTYVGSVSISANNASQTVPVSLIVSAATATTATPTSIAFSYQLGAATPASQTVALTTTGSPLNLTASGSSVGGWLSVNPSSAVSPVPLTVSANPAGLGTGTYNGYITVTLLGESGAAPTTIPVSLTITGASAIVISPTSLTVNYQIGDPNPDPRSILIARKIGKVDFSAKPLAGSGWLSARATSRSLPTSLLLFMDASGLAPGSYTGVIRVDPANSPTQTVTITLIVRAPQNLTLSANSLVFVYQVGGPTPAAQTITVGCSESALRFRPTATSLGSWLAVTFPNGVSGNQLRVSVNPAGLTPRSYSGTVTFFGVGACNTSQSIPITLVVNSDSVGATSSLAWQLAPKFGIRKCKATPRSLGSRKSTALLIRQVDVRTLRRGNIQA